MPFDPQSLNRASIQKAILAALTEAFADPVISIEQNVSGSIIVRVAPEDDRTGPRVFHVKVTEERRQ